MTQGRKNFPTEADIKSECWAHDRHTQIALDQYTTEVTFLPTRSKMATANFCNQPSDYVSKILTEKRKAKKPLMEKMRRARINDSLNELKTLILEALNKDASRYSKMEKADVLEMTVQYLRERKRMEQKQRAMDPVNLPEYRASYVQSSVELSRKMTSLETNDELKANFLAHLASRCQGNSPNAVPVFTSENPRYMAPLKPVMIPFPSPPPSPLQVSPVLPASTSVTRDIGSLSPTSTCITRDTAFISSSSQQHKLVTPAQSSALWRPW